MPKKTPFHDRLETLNETAIWKHWAGYLTAPQYQYSVVDEYYSVRNSVGVFDTTPLFKYRICGRQATKLLSKLLVRNIETCRPGQAQYTCWCNSDGFVLQDGVALRLAENEYWLTSAEPCLVYFGQMANEWGLSDVQIVDLSEDFGILAVQGPHSLDALRPLTDDANSLKYFQATRGELAGIPVTISRTGFTGDLGFELWIGRENALEAWDALFRAGEPYNIVPLGSTALKMARVEAGLLLLDVDFQSARYAWVDAQRETPLELGWRWMLRNLNEDSRDFVGRGALEQQISDRSQRWTTVGLAIDWHDYDRIHREAGIMPPKFGVYEETTMSLYRRGDKPWDYAGFASSFLYSSLLRKPIAIAKLPLDLAKPGTEVDLEITVIRKPVNVLARVHSLPFFSPPRKTKMPVESQPPIGA